MSHQIQCVNPDDIGYYAQRAQMMAAVASKAYGQIKYVKAVAWQGYKEVIGQYD
jgi:hypothetical protein